jgi:hypothetical protein
MTPTDDIAFALTRLYPMPASWARTEVAALVGRSPASAARWWSRAAGGRPGGARWDAGAVTCPPGYRAAYDSWVAGGWQGLCAEEAHGGQGLPFALWAA